MKLAVVVSEFPKTTETFILRDLMEFRKSGMDLRIYYLAPYRKDEILHDFSRPLLASVHHQAMLFCPRVGSAAARTLAQRPAALRGAIADMVRGFRRDPERLAKSLALVPKVLALAEDMATWGADHVHAEFAGHPATAAWIVHRLTGLPYSVSCRAHDIFTSQSLLDVKLGEAVVGGVELLDQLREAAFVRTVSDYNRDFLLRRLPNLDPRRLQVIHSGIDVGAIEPLPPRERGPFFNILFVGSLRKHKGVDVLLKAIRMPQARETWRLDIVGDGPERPSLERLVQDLGLGHRVVFHGNRRFEDIAAFHAGADVVVAPSIIGPGGRTEGIPNVMIEALAYRRPAVASRVTGVPELILHRRTGLLVEPGDPASLAGALFWVERNPDDSAAMAREGRRWVEQHFDLRVSARRQLDQFIAHSRPEILATEGAA